MDLFMRAVQAAERGNIQPLYFVDTPAATTLSCWPT